MNKTMINKLLASAIVTFFCLPSFASEPEDEFIRNGNEKYKKGDYDGAKLEYEKALEKNATSTIANYNLGNTYYKNEDYDSALSSYKSARSNSNNSDEDNANIMHNIGNTYLKKKDYKQCIEAYKESLKLNPNNEDTRYNLAYAKKLLQQQQGQGGGQGGGQGQQQQDQQQDQQNEKQKPNHNPDENPQEGECKLDQNSARQLLDALERDEKDKHNERIKAQMKDVKKKRIEKDW